VLIWRHFRFTTVCDCSGVVCRKLSGTREFSGNAVWPEIAQKGIHLSVWIIIPFAAAIAGLFGALLGAPTLKLRGDYLAIVTLGFGEIIRIFMNNMNAPVNITNGPQGST
jgi:branched-chain amino acid transport system permease protein